MNKSKPRTEHKSVDLKKAVMVADRVELQNVRLVQTNCLLKPGGVKGPYELSMDSNVTTKINTENKNIAIVASFELDAYVKDARKEDPDFKIGASFVLSYKIDNLEGLGEEHIQAFGESNGLYNAWPYWREYVQNIVARMGLPSLTIPVFRLVPKEEKKESGGASKATKVLTVKKSRKKAQK